MEILIAGNLTANQTSNSVKEILKAIIEGDLPQMQLQNKGEEYKPLTEQEIEIACSDVFDI